MPNTDYILMLEAIRAGIPSRDTVAGTVDIRKSLMQKLEPDLEKLAGGGSPKGKLVWGEYGQGKTHFLKQLEQNLLSDGFAVSYISLSRQLNLSNLQQLFPALSSHLRIPGHKLPGLLNPLSQLNPPHELISRLPDIAAKLPHPLPTLIFKAFALYEERHTITLYNALMGKKENITNAQRITREYFKAEMKELPRFRQKEHLMSFFEFLPQLLRAMGYKGWVILIDELEITGKLSKVARLKSYQNLSWLLNLNKEHKLPIYTLAASVKTLQDDVFYGTRKNDSRDIPPMAEQRFGEEEAHKVARFFDFASSDSNIVLAPAKKSDYLQLLEELLEIHHLALLWQYEIPSNFVEEALKLIDYRGKPLRQIVRLFIEIMDIYATCGTLPRAFKDNLISEMDFADFEEDTAGLSETPLQELFDDF